MQFQCLILFPEIWICGSLIYFIKSICVSFLNNDIRNSMLYIKFASHKSHSCIIFQSKIDTLQRFILLKGKKEIHQNDLLRHNHKCRSQFLCMYNLFKSNNLYKFIQETYWRKSVKMGRKCCLEIVYLYQIPCFTWSIKLWNKVFMI